MNRRTRKALAFVPCCRNSIRGRPDLERQGRPGGGVLVVSGSARRATADTDELCRGARAEPHAALSFMAVPRLPQPAPTRSPRDARRSWTPMDKSTRGADGHAPSGW